MYMKNGDDRRIQVQDIVEIFCLNNATITSIKVTGLGVPCRTLAYPDSDRNMRSY